MSGQVSRGSAGEDQADEQAGVAWLSWRGSGGHCLLTAVEVQVVLPAVPGLVLVGEAAVKRSSLVVLDFGLDVFCHSADS